MRQLQIREVTDNNITIDAGGYYLSKVRKSGNGAAIGCPKRYLGKQAIIILVDAIKERL